MLSQIIHEPLLLGAAQAAVATLWALVVVWVARRQSIHLERETLVALVRGLVQVVAAGSVIILLFRSPLWSSALVLAAMMGVAAWIAAQRVRAIPGVFWVALQGIVFGAGVVIITMTLAGAIDATMSALIPIGSMLIANSMNTSAQALERFSAEVEAHAGQIEAALALGAAPEETVVRYVQAAIQASMIPRVDTLRSLGIVWIPGVMAGMILSGSDPVYAALYQFVVIAMIFAASGLSSVICTLRIRSQLFSKADQLLYRPSA